MKHILRIVSLLAGILLALTAVAQEKQGTIWVGGPLMYEFQPMEGPYTFAAGLAPVLIRKTTDLGFFTVETEELKFGFAVEGFYFKDETLNGLGLAFRIGSASGSTYLGPGVFYVNRPEKKIGFRAGAYFPFGDDVVPFVPEIAFGFRI